MGEYFPESGHWSQVSTPLEIINITHLNVLTQICIVVIENKVQGLAQFVSCVGYFLEPGHRSQTSSPLEIPKIIHLNLLTQICMVLIERVKG